MLNQHFFKPLLPSFHSHLTIPVAFFLKNIVGRNEKKTMKLRSDASKKISWEVKIEDQRLTKGWKEFALAHDLQIGDIVIFRQEQDMTFHVTILGPSCCEIQYESRLDEESSQEERILKECSTTRKEKKFKSSPSENRCVTLTLTLKPHNIKYSKLNLPVPFTRMNGINEETKMSLLDKHGVKWSTNLRSEKNYKRIRLIGGWKDFFKANCVKTGESVMLKLIWEEDMSCVLKFCSKVKQ